MAPTPDLRHGHPSSRHYGGCLAFPVSRSFTPREESNRFSLPHSLSRNPPSLFLLEPTNYRFSFFVFRRIEIRERLESDMIIGRMGGKSIFERIGVLREYQGRGGSRARVNFVGKLDLSVARGFLDP